MSKYRTTIELMPISYEIDADNKKQALEYALDCFFDEKIYDIFKYAQVKTQRLKTGEN